MVPQSILSIMALFAASLLPSCECDNGAKFVSMEGSRAGGRCQRKPEVTTVHRDAYWTSEDL